MLSFRRGLRSGRSPRTNLSVFVSLWSGPHNTTRTPRHEGTQTEVSQWAVPEFSLVMCHYVSLVSCSFVICVFIGSIDIVAFSGRFINPSPDY